MSRYPYRYGYGWGGRRSGGAVFDETSLFDVDGAFFDADDPATLYQESTGATLVSATGQQVGFQGDKSQGFALGAELVTNGDFSSAAGWTLKAGALITGGALEINTTGDVFDIAAQPNILAQNRWYEMRVTCTHYTSGIAFVALGDAGLPARVTVNAVGTYRAILFNDSPTRDLDIRAFGAGGTGATVLTLDNVSVRELPDNHATQSGSSFRPFFRETSSVGYLDYDALDDRLVGKAVCGSSGNSIAVKTTVPASLASTQVIMGMSGASTDRFFVGVNTSGFLCAGVGTDSVTTIVGSTDIRGTTGVAFLIEDGTDVFLYWNDTLVYTGARNGAPSTTQPFYYGALNANGTASSFYGGDIWKSINLQRALTATERANILTKWS